MGLRLHCARRVVAPSSRPVIVLAEDSADLRSLLSSGLERVGFDVIPAGTGRELVEIVRRVSIEHDLDGDLALIITDVRMPGFDGITAVRALRDLGVMVPVVFMTAFGDNSVRNEALKLNSRWIDKPVKLDALRALVVELVGIPGKSAPM